MAQNHARNRPAERDTRRRMAGVTPPKNSYIEKKRQKNNI